MKKCTTKESLREFIEYSKETEDEFHKFAQYCPKLTKIKGVLYNMMDDVNSQVLFGDYLVLNSREYAPLNPPVFVPREIFKEQFVTIEENN